MNDHNDLTCIIAQRATDALIAPTMGTISLRDFASTTATIVAITILLTIGGVMITLDQWRVADGFFVLAAVWPFFWLHFQPYRGPQFDWAIFGTTALILCMLIFFTESYRITKILADNHGWLLPANEPTPFDNIPITEDRSILWLGSVPVATHFLPKIVITIDERTMLSINKIKGSVAVSADIASDDGRVIVSLKDNEFTSNPNNILKKTNPDFSTMQVYDQYDKKVLDIHYGNQKVIRMLAVLRYRGQVVEITPDGIFINGRPQFEGIGIISDVGPSIIGVRSH
jgi:hypothetical protein